MKCLVILDPGHGEETKGKRGPIWPDGTQAIEWALNRSIVEKIRTRINNDLVLSRCIEVHTTTDEDKDMPLNERVKIANRLAKDRNAIFISIHFNAATSSKATGWEAWISPNASVKSKKFANMLYDNADKTLSDNLFIRRPSQKQNYWTANFYVLNRTLCPAILSENGFMTNKKDCDFILSSGGQNNIVEAHVSAIKEYFKIAERLDNCFKSKFLSED